VTHFIEVHLVELPPLGRPVHPPLTVGAIPPYVSGLQVPRGRASLPDDATSPFGETLKVVQMDLREASAVMAANQRRNVLDIRLKSAEAPHHGRHCLHRSETPSSQVYLVDTVEQATAPHGLAGAIRRPVIPPRAPFGEVRTGGETAKEKPSEAPSIDEGFDMGGTRVKPHVASHEADEALTLHLLAQGINPFLAVSQRFLHEEVAACSGRPESRSDMEVGWVGHEDAVRTARKPFFLGMHDMTANLFGDSRCRALIGVVEEQIASTEPHEVPSMASSDRPAPQHEDP
jgi:hypothetical protein